jgi:hypothetical protein
MLLSGANATIVLFLGVFVAFAVWRQLRARTVRPATLIVFPALLLLVSFGTLPTDLADAPWEVAVLALAFAAGAVVGWLQVRHTAFFIHPQSGRVMQQGSVVALAIWLVAYVLRFGVRLTAAQPGAGFGAPTASRLGGSLGLITSALMFFSAGLLAGRAVTTYLRYRELKSAAPGEQ